MGSEKEKSDSYDLANAPPLTVRSSVTDALHRIPPHRRNPSSVPAEVERHPVRDFYLPLLLLVAGVLGWFGLGLFAPLYPERGLAISAAVILTAFVTNLALMLGGVFLAAMALGINFGPLSVASFKLGALGTFAGAVFIILARLDLHTLRGPILGWHAVVILYWIFFAKMFELETQETLLTVGIVAFTQAAGACIVLQI